MKVILPIKLTENNLYRSALNETGFQLCKQFSVLRYDPTTGMNRNFEGLRCRSRERIYFRKGPVADRDEVWGRNGEGV